MLTRLRSLPLLGVPLIGALGSLLLVACGDGAEAGGSGTGAVPVASSALRRDARPQAVSARRLLDEGRAGLARPIIESIAGDLGLEGPLLLARLSFLEGDEATWLGLVEKARGMDPSDPRPYATAAEIYAALGRAESARDELRRGVEAASGLTPELQRAQGILSIVMPGMGKLGLERLEAAHRSDPDLPFMGRALGQAYLLGAKRAMAEDAKELALERIRSSLEFDPNDRDARHLYGQILISGNDFVHGLDVLEALYADGEPIGDELGSKHWSAGFFAQVNRERGAARKHYLRARELGNKDVEQGTARQFMAEEFNAAFERADAASRLGEDSALRIAIAEMVGLRGGSEPSVRNEIALLLLDRADRALTERDLTGATGLLAGAVFADRAVARAAEIGSSIFLAKAIDAIERREGVLAVAYAEEATLAQPDSAMAWHLLGELQFDAGEYEAAADALEKAVAFAQVEGRELGIDVSLMLAESQHLADRVPDAIATLEQCVRDAQPAEVTQREAAERYLGLLRR